MKKIIATIIISSLQLSAFSFWYTLHNKTVAEISLENYYLKVRIGNPTATVRQKNRELWASIGINGSFFCPAERAYNYCGANNSTSSDRIVAWVVHSKYPNDTGERWIVGVTKDNQAIFVQNNNRQWYMKNTNQERKQDIQYGLGNFPILVDNGIDVTIEMTHLIDNKMFQKWTRSFICIPESNDKVFMGFVPNKSMFEMGRYLIDTYNCHFAINLDAWWSSAMVVDDKHIIGPWRRVVDGFVAVAKPAFIESKINNYSFSKTQENNINILEQSFRKEIHKKGSSYKEKILDTFGTRETSAMFYPLVDKRAMLREMIKRIEQIAPSTD